jgi:hypothetical protein
VGVILHEHPADLYDRVGVGSDAEVDGVGSALARKMDTVGRVTKITASAELVVGRQGVISTGSRTTPDETVAQRKAAPVRPEFGFMTYDREEIWASHDDLVETIAHIVAPVALLKSVEIVRLLLPCYIWRHG